MLADIRESEYRVELKKHQYDTKNVPALKL